MTNRERYYLFLKKFTGVAFLILVYPFFKTIRVLDRAERRWRGAIWRRCWRVSHKWDNYKYEQERGDF